MKILITGANGMVARAAIEFCLSIGDEVVTYTRQKLDISDRKKILTVFRKTKTRSDYKLCGLHGC